MLSNKRQRTSNPYNLRNILIGGLSSGIAGATGFNEDTIESFLDSLPSNTQESVFGMAQNAINAMSGSTSDAPARSNVTAPAAALIPGRGAELGLMTKAFQRASKLNLPTGGAKLHNAFAEMCKAWGPVSCRMGFAYKGILAVSAGQQDPQVTRYYTHQFFRHCDTTINSSAYADTTLEWHKTLGPDDSYIRQVPPAGSSTGPPSGYNNTLKSPYRYPSSGAVQMVRLDRPLLENIGWNANPMKLITANSTGNSGSLASDNLLVYRNAATEVVDSATITGSLPNKQPRNASFALPSNDTSCYYRSQNGPGTVSYQFANDGTGPVVVDVVITKLRKGETFATCQDYADSIYRAVGQGFLNQCFGNRGVISLQGAIPLISDPWTNAKTQFMPKSAFKYYREGSGAGTNSRIPFVYVARDQFIVDAGAVKPYSFKLPALNYDARAYEQSAEDVDDLTYCVSIAFSTTATPVLETGTTGTSILDRKGNSLNVAVTGSYHETPHPVYMNDYVNQFFVNGVLTNPLFTGTAPSLARVSIAPPETVVRSQNDGSAYIQVGPSNTQSGA